MKIVLRSDVSKVGMAGDVKNVADGFARNFLFPRGLALQATPEAVKWFEKGKEKRDKVREKKAGEARSVSGKLDGVALSFSRPVNEEGKLFGSVGKTDIVKSLRASGFEIAAGAINLDNSIKEAGDHTVEIRLHHDVTAKIKVSVIAQPR